MLIFCMCCREYICNIFVCVYVRVVDYSSSLQISTVVTPNIDVFSLSFDDSCGDTSESTLIVAVDWQWWWVVLRTVNILLQLEEPFRFSRGFWAGNEFGLESWHGDETFLWRMPRDSTIIGEQHMASMRLAVRAVITPIGIRVSYEIIVDVDAVDV